MYLYLKALHIIFVVTWFSGLFYIVRLFIYNTEANDQPMPAKSILQQQFTIMIKRLWLGITWPSAIITLCFGLWLLHLYPVMSPWLWIKLGFVLLLYAYHITLHVLYKQQANSQFKYSSQQLRLWNEVATVFLISIVMLVVVKQSLSVVWGLIGLVLFVILLLSAIKIYKIIRLKAANK
ncbi:CopD family protein [Ferruginibacter yonginensis]|uniref:Protoporphyrinogen IX oxidase n=1 Tax=Ferruginibacter yonginensis TaxID=1310416 RepID=A0ABV8QPX8_9BACT